MDTATAPRALRRIPDLPGPPGLPFIGNGLQVRVDRIHLDVEKWGREYGPIFRFKLGKLRVLGVTDHDLIAQVLKDRPDGFRRMSRVSEVSREMGCKTGVFGSEGQTWLNQRRMVMASFAPSHVRSFFPTLLKVTQRLHGRWLKAVRAGEGIPLQGDLMRYTIDGVAGLAFGTDMNTLESDHEVIQHHLDKIFPAIFRRLFARIPYWRYFRLPVDRDLDHSVAIVNQAVDDFIAQARARLQANPELRTHPTSLLEAMIVAADMEGSGVDDKQVAGNVLTMLLAGEDTTANTLAWMIYLLYRNPAALQRATEEVRRVAPDPAAYTQEQMEALDYLEACASETMRLKPVAPFLPFEALHDTTLGDVQVPAGTIVWCVLRHDSLEGRHFPEPQRFDPERWLGTAEHSPVAGTSRRVSMPFGAGARTCPGRYLAMLEIKMAMAALLGSFDIESVHTQGGGDAREIMAFAMGPEALTLKLREKAAAEPAR